MARLRFRQIETSPGKWELVEITNDAPATSAGPTVIGDIAGYQSPVDGKWVEGRAQRRNDLARTGSRPWEGLEVEKQEAARHRQYAEQRSDAAAEKAAWQAFYSLSPSKREALMRRG